MKGNFKRFFALFLALAMILVSGVVLTNDGFKANEEKHEHTDACYEVSYVADFEKLTCGMEEHMHSVEDGCYKMETETELQAIPGTGTYNEETEVWDGVEYETVVVTKPVYDDDWNMILICTKPEHYHIQEVGGGVDTNNQPVPCCYGLKEVKTLNCGNEKGEGESEEEPEEEPTTYTTTIKMRKLGQDGDVLGSKQVTIREDGTFDSDVVAKSFGADENGIAWVPVRVAIVGNEGGMDAEDSIVNYSGDAIEQDALLADAAMGDAEGVTVEDGENNPILILDLEKGFANDLFNKTFTISSIKDMSFAGPLNSGDKEIQVWYIPCKLDKSFNFRFKYVKRTFGENFEYLGEETIYDEYSYIIDKKGNIIGGPAKSTVFDGYYVFGQGINIGDADGVAEKPNGIKKTGEVIYSRSDFVKPENVPDFVRGFVYIDESNPDSNPNPYYQSIIFDRFAVEGKFEIAKDIEYTIDLVGSSAPKAPVKTSFTVKYVDEDGNEIMDSAKFDGYDVGTTFTKADVEAERDGWFLIKEYNKNGTKYTYKGDFESITLVEDADENVITLVYSSEEMKTPEYKVTINHFVNKGDGTYENVNSKEMIIQKGEGGRYSTDTIKIDGEEAKITQIIMNNNQWLSFDEGATNMTFIQDGNVEQDIVYDVYFESNKAPVNSEDDTDTIVPIVPAIPNEPNVPNTPVAPSVVPNDDVVIDTPEIAETPAPVETPEVPAPIETPEPVIEVVPAPAVPATPVAPTPATPAVEVGIDGDGNLVLTPVDDVEAALANQDLGHICNILYFIILLCTTVALGFYYRSAKLHNERIFELRKELGEDDPYKKN